MGLWLRINHPTNCLIHQNGGSPLVQQVPPHSLALRVQYTAGILSLVGSSGLPVGTPQNSLVYELAAPGERNYFSDSLKRTISLWSTLTGRQSQEINPTAHAQLSRGARPKRATPPTRKVSLACEGPRSGLYSPFRFEYCTVSCSFGHY